MKYEVKEAFDLTNRGVALVIDETTERNVTTKYKVKVIDVEEGYFFGVATKEWMLRRISEPIEKEAFVVLGLYKSQLQKIKFLEFIDGAI